MGEAVTRFSWTLDMFEGIYEKRRAENADFPEMRAFYDGKLDALKTLAEEFNEIFGIAPKEEAEDAAC